MSLDSSLDDLTDLGLTQQDAEAFHSYWQGTVHTLIRDHGDLFEGAHQQGLTAAQAYAATRHQFGYYDPALSWAALWQWTMVECCLIQQRPIACDFLEEAIASNRTDWDPYPRTYLLAAFIVSSSKAEISARLEQYVRAPDGTSAVTQEGDPDTRSELAEALAMLAALRGAHTCPHGFSASLSPHVK